MSDLVQYYVNGKYAPDGSLFSTQYISSDPFEADAETEYDKKKRLDQERVLEEIRRRNAEGDYNV
jgi:hypothetical protein